MAFPALLAVADRAVRQHLGGAVVYTAGAAAGGGVATVDGVFDSVYVRQVAGQPGVVSTGPAVFLRLEDLPSDPETDQPTITVDGRSYSVREPHKDGIGGVLLLLHLA